MQRGIQRYLDIGLPASKLVLGVPWYGYHYPCLEGTALDARYCPIKSVPFRGVNCSDAAGSEMAFSDILTVLRGPDAAKTGGLQWDTNMGAAFFNSALQQGLVEQYWFDNAEALAPKYEYAKNMGLLGVGPFCFTYLDAVNQPTDTEGMWTALDAFF